jgi:hypothetical protein
MTEAMAPIQSIVPVFARLPFLCQIAVTLLLVAKPILDLTVRKVVPIKAFPSSVCVVSLCQRVLLAPATAVCGRPTMNVKTLVSGPWVRLLSGMGGRLEVITSDTGLGCQRRLPWPPI